MKHLRNIASMVGLVWLGLMCGCAVRQPAVPSIPVNAVSADWDNPAAWSVTADGHSRGQLDAVEDSMGPCLKADYTLKADGGWIQMAYRLAEPVTNDLPITFLIKAPDATGALEIKFVDNQGTTYGAKLALKGQFKDWTRITTYLKDLSHWWGGSGTFDKLAEFHFAFSGTGQGVVLLDDVGFPGEAIPSSYAAEPVGHNSEWWEDGRYRILRSGPVLDPDRELPGIGFKQRRADVMIPEDPRVLEWLKTLQDESSPGRQVLPTTENNQLQTFNNSLVAIAFILKGEKERAERILDFYAARTVRDNQDPTLQNFFYKGEARGFFQQVELNDKDGIKAFHHTGDSDRWTGDMAWMLMAYKYYELEYGAERYREITGLILDLLISWYSDDPKVPGGGYVDHGWRKGDKYLHEGFGHAEGNIDCYAVFKLYGKDELAARIRTWLESVATGTGMPLDLYTWRVLAYDGERCDLLDIPDFDLRYRKTLMVNGRQVTGPYHSADMTVDNIWLDGLGHIACAYAACGNVERARFYANQFDPILMESTLGGKSTLTLPYTLNEQGGFNFDQSKGIISVAAWYIFAKNEFNPMRLRRCGNPGRD